MRTAAAIVLLLLSAAFFQQCKEEEYDIIHSIPKEDRFVYKSGDLLLYSCTCGSADTVEIKETRFWTETGTLKDWLGLEYTYSVDCQSIILEKGEWINALYYAWSYDDSCKVPCIVISTSNYDDKGLPMSWIANGCNQLASISIAGSDVTFPMKSINDSIYKNVYSYSNNQFDTAMAATIEILWNLKYGVIHFSAYLSGNWRHWNLEGKIQE